MSNSNISDAVANDLVDAFISGKWIGLSIGDPGTNGETDNPPEGASYGRVQPTFGDPAASRQAANTAEADFGTPEEDWTEGEEQVTHITFWDSEEGSDFAGAVKLGTPRAMPEGTPVVVPVGNLVVAVAVNVAEE